MFSQKQFGLIFVAVLFSGGRLGWAQESGRSNESACLNSQIVSVPSRPTVTSATETTQCGVAELEYGLERQWPGNAAKRDDLAGGLRFGLLPNLDFHWSSTDFLHVMDASADRNGFGDTWLGLKYRLLGQTKLRPSFGFFYQVKIPSASVLEGLGSGEFDHSFSFLVSKDVRRIHFDFNAIPLLAGRPGASGFDHDTGLALSGAAPMTHRLGFVAEGYGYTALNTEAPAFASLMGGFTYAVNPRFILDSGMDFGVTHDAPHKRVWLGATYAVGNLYGWLRHDSE
jgi:hypothetical protein